MIILELVEASNDAPHASAQHKLEVLYVGEIGANPVADRSSG
jgi:hypothetical protein